MITAPLNLEPANDQEKYINDMRTQYRTYYLEYNVHDVGAIFRYYIFCCFLLLELLCSYVFVLFVRVL
jgi:hypothetical protein